MRLTKANWLTCALWGATIICSDARATGPSPVKAEQVYLSNAGIACPTQAEFLEIVQHASRGEMTLASQMMRGGGGNCVNLPAGIKIRILHADPTIFAGHDVVEFNPEGHPQYEGAWGSDQLLGKRIK